MLLTQLVFLFALEAGLYTDFVFENSTHDLLPPDVRDELLTYTLLETRITYRRIFVEGGFESIQYPDGGRSQFWPILQRYDIGAGVNFGPLALGVQHFCMHPVAPYDDVQWVFDWAETAVYARLELEF